MEKKVRLDVLLVEKGHFSTREKAKAAIMAGLVRVDGETVVKAGTKVLPHAKIEVAAPLHPYVSRGGLKLEKALRVFEFEMDGAVVVDVGASTGGFTDCALQHGARHVYAVDVGYGQIAWKLRQDPRVTVMDRTNFRHVSPDVFQDPRPDVAVVDVSFISLDKILPVLKQVLPPHGDVLSLVKPQFEAGRNLVGKKGVVRDPAVHKSVLFHVFGVGEANAFHVHNLTYSPITGGEGNIEFLVHWVKQGEPKLSDDDLRQLVEVTVHRAHSHLY